MSRLKRFAHGLASGYLLTGINIFYTFVSIPLALRYLSKVDFGLWALASQVAGYIALIDLGLSGSAVRVLMDHKDERDGKQYGSVIQASILVNIAQGLIILVGGSAVSVALGPLLHIAPPQSRIFLILMLGQCLVMWANFSLRIFGTLLIVHQRYDLGNYAQALQLLIAIPVMWFALNKGHGVYSLLWAQAAGFLISHLTGALFALHLRLFPSHGSWGKPSGKHFSELISFGRDMFLMTLGGMFINASQTIIVTRVLGLNAGAVWTVCTRVFNMGVQLLFRIYDFSMGAFVEMFVRNEMERLQRRFCSIVVLSSSLGVLAGVIIATSNQPFVSVWTHGKITWSSIDDLLLGFWLVIQTIAHCHLGLIGVTKRFHFLRWVYLVEGCFFILCSLPALFYGGIAWMLIVSIIGTCLCSLQYGFRRTAHLFNLSLWVVAWEWLQPTIRFGLGLALLALPVAMITSSYSNVTRVAVNGGVIGILGFLLLLCCGLDGALKRELLHYLRKRWEQISPRF